MDDQPVFVAAQIKDDPIVAYEVDGAAKLPLYLGRICPTRFRCSRHPGTDRAFGMRVTRPEFPQRPAGDHLHDEIISCHHFGDKRICGRSGADAPDSCPRGVAQYRTGSALGALIPIAFLFEAPAGVLSLPAPGCCTESMCRQTLATPDQASGCRPLFPCR